MRVLKVWYLAALASGMTALYIYFSGVSNSDDIYELSRTDKGALAALQIGFSKCVNHNGLGLEAVAAKKICQVTLKYPSDTVSSWRDAKTGEVEGLSFDFNLCEAVATWEQVRNSTTILTKEYIDALPNGWHEYAWRRINKGILLNNCKNKTLCMEKLKLVLPETPPYVPHQFGRCAVVGNSGDLLKTNFGEEIDKFDVVIRENGAPIQNYTKHVGRKSTFRILNRGSAKALDKVVELDESRKEVLIVKTTIHDIMNKMIKEIPIKNPVYLMLGTSFGSSAKGTGLKALEFALSVCDSVDMYGFTVDPGYKEWTRYFSESRGGHTPLLGRTYFQMMECLGLVKIHSPMRANPNRVIRWLPSQRIINAARVASEKILRRVGAGMEGPLRACSIIRRREKAMEKRENLVQSGLREAAIRHQEYTEGATLYPMEKHPGHGMLINHGVDEELLERVKTDITVFFNLPLEQKKSVAIASNSAEGFRHHFASSEQKLDWGDMLYLTTRPVNERNLRFWPTNPPTFRNTFNEYSLKLNKVTSELLEAMSKDLGIESDVLFNLFKGQPQSMRMNYYPPCPQPEKVLGLMAHTDGTGLTLLLHVNDVQGLQIRKDKMWFNVETLPGAFVVNIGDILEIASNGKYPSIEHRAVVNSTKERISIANFQSPPHFCTVGPLPEVVRTGKENYKSLPYLEYIKGYISDKQKARIYMESLKIN